jgi:hypothetical protein
LWARGLPARFALVELGRAIVNDAVADTREEGEEALAEGVLGLPPALALVFGAVQRRGFFSF